MPKYWKSKTLLIKLETTYGVDPAPTGAANAILATNVSFSPMEGEDVARNLERPYLGATPSTPAALRSVLSFDIEAVGSGSLGVAPGWGPVLRACAAAQVVTAGVKVEYTPITASQESVAIYFSIDGTRHVLLGARGTAVYKLNAQGIPVFSCTLTGTFTTPSEQAIPAVSYASFQAPQIANNANTPIFTIGGSAFILRDFELDLACQVEPRLLIGSEAILITGKNETVKATVEAVPVSTYNPFAVAQAASLQAIVLQHGTVAGRRVQIDVPYAVQQRLTSYGNTQDILEWPLTFSAQPSAGNDQWKLTLT